MKSNLKDNKFEDSFLSRIAARANLNPSFSSFIEPFIKFEPIARRLYQLLDEGGLRLYSPDATHLTLTPNKMEILSKLVNYNSNQLLSADTIENILDLLVVYLLHAGVVTVCFGRDSALYSITNRLHEKEVTFPKFYEISAYTITKYWDYLILFFIFRINYQFFGSWGDA